MLIFLSLKLRFDSPLFWRYCRGGRVFCSLVFLYIKKKTIIGKLNPHDSEQIENNADAHSKKRKTFLLYTSTHAYSS